MTEKKKSKSKARPQIQWKPASLLDMPKANPGMTQRWVRTTIHGEQDHPNVTKKQQQGWTPRLIKAADRQEGFRPVSNGSALDGAIQANEMVLMEIPIEVAEQRKAYYRNKQSQQSNSINRMMNSGPTAFDNSQHSVSVGRERAE